MLLRSRRHRPVTPADGPFPGFEDVTEMGTGRFATVYRATERDSGRRVALKALRLDRSAPGTAEAFERQVKALALLGAHPHVVTLYRAIFSSDGRPVLVLELCQGPTAGRPGQSGPLGATDVVQLGVKVASALGTAHRSGLVHRDVRPSKILLSQFGEPVLGDFGLAALRSTAQASFATAHAPPEELEGLPASPATDIYGLASSMYQLLLGRSPFASYEDEPPVSAILRILRDPPPRLPVGAVPVDLADLLEGALAKDPRDRPPGADEFAAALQAIEAAAGWPQTPYVVSGALAAGGLGGTVPASGAQRAATAAAAAHRSAADLARSLTQGLDGPADPWRPTAAVDLPPPPSPRAPGPPGTRTVVAPPTPARHVLAPSPADRAPVPPLPALPRPPVPPPPSPSSVSAWERVAPDVRLRHRRRLH